MRVGMIGMGAIGQGLVRIVGGDVDIQLVGAAALDYPDDPPPGAPPQIDSLEALLALQPDVVVEAAGHGALRAHGPAVLRAGTDLIFVSIGALADADTEREIREAAEAGGAKARFVSGAIGALDALSAAAVGGLVRVVHTTRKPARTFLPPEEAEQLIEAKEIFHGSAREGALRFPESVNVAAAVSVAGLGLDKTELRVLADPFIDRNQHEFEAEGLFGTMHFQIRNVPSAENPKSASIVAMSLARALRNRQASFGLG
jgi:aspartate dehydrogenase